jgi:hypothetical protein
MKKLFISQPMRGKTDEEIIATREKAIRIGERYLDEKVEVIDSFFQDETEVENKPLWYLGKSLMLMADADLAFFTENWDDYRGCRIENICAHEYGIKVFEINTKE